MIYWGQGPWLADEPSHVWQGWPQESEGLGAPSGREIQGSLSLSLSCSHRTPSYPVWQLITPCLHANALLCCVAYLADWPC